MVKPIIPCKKLKETNQMYYIMFFLYSPIVNNLLVNMITIRNRLILYSFILGFYCGDSISPSFSHSNTNNALWNKGFTLPTNAKFVFQLCKKLMFLLEGQKGNQEELCYVCSCTFPMSPTTEISCSFRLPSANMQRSSIPREPLSNSTITYALSIMSGT